MVVAKVVQEQVQQRAYRRLGNLVLEGYSPPQIATLSVAEPSTSASGALLTQPAVREQYQAAGAHIR